MIIRFKILNLLLLGSPNLLITPAVSFLLFFSEAGKHSKCYIHVAFIFITVSYSPDLFCRETADRQIEQSTRLKYIIRKLELQPNRIILNAWNRETWHYC